MIDIEKLAREAGVYCTTRQTTMDAMLQRLAALIRAEVLEEAAALAGKRGSAFYPESPFSVELDELAAAIRALKDK